MRPDPVHQLPADYRSDYRLSILDAEQVNRLNLLGIGLLIPFFIGGRLWLDVVRATRGPFEIEMTYLRLPLFLLAVVGVLILHEWIHGLAIRWAGHRPRYGMKGAKMGRVTIPIALFATADNAYFHRTPFIIIALAPVVVITFAGLLLMLFLPDGVNYYVVLALVFNGSGAAGDIWMSAVIWRYDEAHTLIRDEEDAITVFVRDPHT